MSGRRFLVGAATVAGLALGWVATGWQLERRRLDLFHPRPVRRWAALNWLASQPSAETLHLLRDYLGWEQQPLLRRRGSRLLRRLEVSVT